MCHDVKVRMNRLTAYWVGDLGCRTTKGFPYFEAALLTLALLGLVCVWFGDYVLCRYFGKAVPHPYNIREFTIIGLLIKYINITN